MKEASRSTPSRFHLANSAHLDGRKKRVSGKKSAKGFHKHEGTKEQKDAQQTTRSSSREVGKAQTGTREGHFAKRGRKCWGREKRGKHKQLNPIFAKEGNINSFLLREKEAKKRRDSRSKSRTRASKNSGKWKGGGGGGGGGGGAATSFKSKGANEAVSEKQKNIVTPPRRRS